MPAGTPPRELRQVVSSLELGVQRGGRVAGTGLALHHLLELSGGLEVERILAPLPGDLRQVDLPARTGSTIGASEGSITGLKSAVVVIASVALLYMATVFASV